MGHNMHVSIIANMHDDVFNFYFSSSLNLEFVFLILYSYLWFLQSLFAYLFLGILTLEYISILTKTAKGLLRTFPATLRCVE